MGIYNIGLSADKKTVYISLGDVALPAAATQVLTDIEHNDPDDAVHPFADNHTLWHHVRDLLYPLGIENMQAISIVKHGDGWHDTRLVLSGLAPIAPAATDTIVINYAPSGALGDNSHFTYQSSDVTKATVSAAGVVTGVAAGTAIITVTHEVLNLSAQIEVTVTA